MLFERRLVPASKIRAEYSKFQFELKEKDIVEKKDPLDNIDYEAIKTNIPFHNTSEGRDIFEDDTYTTKDKMLEVVEGHTDRSVSIWINGIYH